MSDVTALCNNGLHDTPFQRAAKSGATDARNGDLDPHLEAVIDAWAHLPEAVKADIVAMIEGDAVRVRVG